MSAASNNTPQQSLLETLLIISMALEISGERESKAFVNKDHICMRPQPFSMGSAASNNTIDGDDSECVPVMWGCRHR